MRTVKRKQLPLRRPDAESHAKLLTKPCFKMEVNPSGDLEVLIYEEIGYNFWTDSGITAKTIREQMDSAEPHSKITVRINSPGGDAFEGVAIGNVLKSSGKRIHVYVDGIAASAASIIAMSGNVITMANNSMMMIHNAWSMCMGDAGDMHKMGDTLEKISASIAQTYAEKTGMPIEEVAALMDAETWLSAEDCLAQGFATAIAEEPNEQALAMARNFKALARLRRVPASLKAAPGSAAPGLAQECKCACQACEAGNCEECTNGDCDDPNCTDCPMQGDAGNRSDLSLRQAQLWLLQNAITLEESPSPFI